MASAVSVSYKRRKDECSEPPVVASEPRTLNDLPDEILLKILSHFGPEDLCFIIAHVCERWNALAKDVALWKKLSYYIYDDSTDVSDIQEVRCTKLLGFKTNYLKNFAPSSALKYKILNSISENGLISKLS
jgi:hypothetical protein